MFLSQRRTSSLARVRPSIIGNGKYKSLQNENAISDGEDTNLIQIKKDLT